MFYEIRPQFCHIDSIKSETVCQQINGTHCTISHLKVFRIEELFFCKQPQYNLASSASLAIMPLIFLNFYYLLGTFRKLLSIRHPTYCLTHRRQNAFAITNSTDAYSNYKFSTKLLSRSVNCQCPRRRMRGKKTRQRKKHAKMSTLPKGAFFFIWTSFHKSFLGCFIMS